MAPLIILLKTADFVAVNKPSGISVHNNEDPQNLILLLERQFPAQKFYPVHRLDKETSGVQVLALHEKAARQLAEEFQARSVRKIYVGVLRGQLKVSEGIWNQALTDKSEGRKNPSGISRERIPCETRYRVIEGSKFFSYCEFDLITGRQHQIRKHSSLANHALVGDPRYGDAKYNQKIAGMYQLDRMFLHCQTVEISNHKIEAPIPDSFAKILSASNRG